MSLERILELVSQLGLTVSVDATNTPRVRGPQDALAPEVLEALKAYRDEIIERFGKKVVLSRRVVLLADDGSVERVLAELAPGEELDALRSEAEKHPGRRVAAEHLSGGAWVRFVTKEGAP